MTLSSVARNISCMCDLLLKWLSPFFDITVVKYHMSLETFTAYCHSLLVTITNISVLKFYHVPPPHSSMNIIPFSHNGRICILDTRPVSRDVHGPKIFGPAHNFQAILRPGTARPSTNFGPARSPATMAQTPEYTPLFKTANDVTTHFLQAEVIQVMCSTGDGRVPCIK